jgi:hypothetical protein
MKLIFTKSFKSARLNRSIGSFLLVAAFYLFTSPAGFSQAIWSSAALTDASPYLYNPFTLSQTNVANITVSGIGRGSGISGNAGSNRYNARDWSTSGIDLTDYFYFRITPGSGYAVNFVSFAYTGQKSGTGPANFAIRSSLDNYATDITTTTSTGTTVTLSGASFQNVTSVIEFRLYGWGGSSAAGTYSVNSFSFNGAVVTASAGCGLPAALQKANVTDTSVNLMWNAPSSVPSGGYEYAVTNSATPPSSGTNVSDTFVHVASLLFSTKYYIHLRSDCGSSNFSGWVTDSVTTALPVKLVGFTAERKNNDIVLEWATAQELNNSHFEVERSADKKRFEKIGVVKGAGNSADRKSYHFTDFGAGSNEAYYRLRQVDFNGEAAYSDVVRVAGEASLSEFLFYPNPAKEAIQLLPEHVETGKNQVEIYDLSGRLMIANDAGSVQGKIDVTSLAPGFYILHIISEERTISSRLIIKK